ncbi:hypothetical protein [Streptomyces sp. NPDC001296]
MPTASTTRALMAVSAASNQSTADKDPSQWLPPYADYRCQYVTDWIADKARCRLSVDPAEEAALTESLDRGPDVPINVALAR